MNYEEWYEMFVPVAPEYEETKRKAVRFIWESRAEPGGYIKEPMIRFSKPPERNCFSWHQVYFALTMSNADLAAATLMNMFPNQDEFGELPDLMTEDYINITATKPPIHGYGLLRMMERFGDRLAPPQAAPAPPQTAPAPPQAALAQSQAEPAPPQATLAPP